MNDDSLAVRIRAFLASDPIAVVGASRNPAKYGNIVLAALLESGRRAIPVNPREEEILGIAVVPSVDELPADVRALSVITPPPVTEKVVVAAIACGIERIWLQPGAESAAAIATAEGAGIDVIAEGPCILVSLARERSDSARERSEER